MNRRKKRLTENAVTGMGILISIASVVLIVLTGCSMKQNDAEELSAEDKNSVENSLPVNQQEQKKIQNNLFNGSALKSDTDIYRYNDPKQHVSSSFGIDVSSRQGTIDWQDVKNSGVEFAFIRIGGRVVQTGQIVADERFEENLQGARSAGIKTGVYFYSNAEDQEEAVEEAQFVVDRIRNTSIDYPVVYVYEPGTAAETSVTENAVAFCAEIASAGLQPMIYMNDQLCNGFYNTDQIKNIPIWYAGYNKFPAADYPFAAWQYTNQGMLKGVEICPVDFDLMFIKRIPEKKKDK